MSDNIFNKKDLALEQLIFHTRGDELRQIIKAIQKDQDITIAGSSGSGRQITIKIAAEKSNSSVIEFDCMQFSSDSNFIENFISKFNLIALDSNKIKSSSQENWNYIISALESMDKNLKIESNRLLFIFRNCSFIHNWGSKNEKEHIIKNWNQFLYIINKLKRINYCLTATYGELEIEELSKIYKTENLILLKPLTDKPLAFWADIELRKNNMYFDPIENSMGLYLKLVEGSFSDSLSLIRRLILIFSPIDKNSETVKIDNDKVKFALNEILRDLSMYFENFLLSLPTTQAQLMYSLAIDPTDKPHKKSYALKHNLKSGGSIQSAINSLSRKGVIYKSKHLSDINYRLSLPFLSIWMKRQRLI